MLLLYACKLLGSGQMQATNLLYTTVSWMDDNKRDETDVHACMRRPKSSDCTAAAAAAAAAVPHADSHYTRMQNQLQLQVAAEHRVAMQL
jgi:hypothetical protein